MVWLRLVCNGNVRQGLQMDRQGLKRQGMECLGYVRGSQGRCGKVSRGNYKVVRYYGQSFAAGKGGLWLGGVGIGMAL